MISFFPEIYPDELAYSWFCRYYVHSGCLTYRAALLDLFEKKSCNPSKEFIGYLNAGAKQVISSIIPLDRLVLSHTMFPQYARFVPLDKKRNALKLLCEGSTDPHHLLTILIRNENNQWLRYCQLCVNEDRKRYGETYWHRIHQIRNINICIKHGCRLINSPVSVKSEHSFNFSPAETVIEPHTADFATNSLERQFAAYCTELFEAPVDFTKDVLVSCILYNAMKSTEYMKRTGRCRYTKRFFEDITEYYSQTDLQYRITFAQIQRAMLGNLAEFTTVTQLAFFLGIKVQDILAPKLSENVIFAEQESHYMKSAEPVNWAELDTKTAPRLKRLAYDIYYGVDGGRPDRVSEKMICRELGLLGHQLENLPKCRAIYKKYAEPYGSAWARRIVWAYDKLLNERNGKPFYLSDIRKLSGVKKVNFPKAMLFLPSFADSEKTAKITALCDPKKG